MIVKKMSNQTEKEVTNTDNNNDDDEISEEILEGKTEKKIKESDTICNKAGNVKLKLKNIRIIGTWDYACDNKECYLCHTVLQLPIRTNNNLCGDIKIGDCNHGFHKECLIRWTSSGNNKCPYCDVNWTLNETVSSKVYMYHTYSKRI